VSLDGALSPAQQHLSNRILGYWCSDGSPAHLWLDDLAKALSPYELIGKEAFTTDTPPRSDRRGFRSAGAAPSSGMRHGREPVPLSSVLSPSP